MVIALFGESCTGKSTIAEQLKSALGATVYSGKDYLRLAKGETEAAARFKELLAAASEPIIYVISDAEHLAFLPKPCLRVLVVADIGLIKERFAQRTGGKLPPPVAAMLERKHGMFDSQPHDLKITSGEDSAEAACEKILDFLGR